MEEIKTKLIKYLKENDIYSENDFKNTSHGDICIELSKFCKIIDKTPKIDKTKIKKLMSNFEYILLSDAGECLKEMTDVRNYYLVDLQEIFGLLKTFETNGFNLIKHRKIYLSGQSIFTYSLWKIINKYFPDLFIKIEENFLLRFDKNIIINQNKGPRVDIIIEKIDIVIEYDEAQHSVFEHEEKDNSRDNAIRGHGYEVYRFTEGKDPIKFYKDLIDKIKDRYILFNPNKYGEWIIDYFVRNKLGSKNMISLLTSEQVTDIINKVPSDEIGNTPRNIRLKKNIFEWLDIKEISEQKKIRLLLDDIDGTYEEEDDDIILSPNTFEKLLGRIDANEYENISHIRDCYIKIKNKFMERMYTDIIKFVDLRELQKSTLSFVINQAYERGEKDCCSKYKDLQKKNEYLTEKIKNLEDYINSQLPHNKKGFIKENIKSELSELQIGKYIIPEIPELIYTGNMDNYEDESKIGLFYELNKKRYKNKDMRSLSKCINIIKKKIDNNTTDFLYFESKYEKNIYGCKIESQKTPKINIKKNNISLDESDDDEI